MQLTGDEGSPAADARLSQLLATDAELRAALADDAVTTALREPSMPLHRQIETVMTAYADRPALAERAAEPVVDPATGRTTRRLLPRFDTITYRELWAR